jgi:two-component system chemotaxis sensor kinase CheA
VTDKDTEFLQKLLVTFAVEAQEHLQGLSLGLLRLESNEDTSENRAKLVETIFREAHSLKGASRAVNQGEIEALCQAMEEIFSALKKNTLQTSAGLFDLLQEVLDFLGRILTDVATARTHDDKILQRQLINRLEEAVSRSDAQSVPQESPLIPPLPDSVIQIDTPPPRSPDSSAQKVASPAVLPETVRVSTARLTSLLLQTEEMLSVKLASFQRVLDMRSASAGFSTWNKEWARVQPLLHEIRPTLFPDNDRRQSRSSTDVKNSLARVLDFMDWNSTFIKSFETRFTSEVKSAEQDDRIVGSMVNNLLGDMKKVLMFPFSSLLEILPKIVRDLSRENGKKIEMTISGEEIEIDRRILEEMKDPLVHLIRNCIDHGIESPLERERKGKPPCGTIRVAVFPLDDKVELTVTDDGGGIATEAVRSALVKLGTLSRETVAELDSHELLAHIFHSGVTTSPIITEISGRGLGLAIVREKVEKIGGTITVATTLDSGTTFCVVLPLTVATLRGVLVRLGDHLFVLPAMYVVKVVRVKAEEIKSVENRETISFDGEPVSLTRLADVLELSSPRAHKNASDLLHLVILAASNTRIAFQVDEVLGELEVLQKGMGRQLSRVRNVAGATLLGNGHVAPILNVTDLLKSAVKIAAFSTRRDSNADTDEHEIPVHSVLVVEDSITTRTLLKNILESAGYEVVTAVDGMDACSKLEKGRFDIVISDVEMPRMNGFDLTARIRSDKNLGDLPVVLVTALASREDRERGIDVGANAYIVKGDFDQSNLLDVIKKLI